MAEIIEKILKESGIKGVAVNSRMITAFRKKFGCSRAKWIPRERREVRASAGCLTSRNQVNMLSQYTSRVRQIRITTRE